MFRPIAMSTLRGTLFNAEGGERFRFPVWATAAETRTDGILLKGRAMTHSATNETVQFAIDPDALIDLASRFGGQVMTPGEPGYDESRTLWNHMIDRHPAVITLPAGVSDVLQSITFAREHGLEISVKGGGHNVAGYATTDGGLMIDLENLRMVRVEPQRRTARAGGGARWADFDRETGVFGLATTGGVISTTGVAGLTLGGGVGWLVGKYGLASDNLRSVDVVTADGAVITASDESHPDLFWALRGGGGNFGVVTSMEFRLYPVDTVFAGMIAYPIEVVRDVLEFFREFTATAPDELTMYCSLMTELEYGARVVAIPFCWSGDIEGGQRVLQPVLGFGAPLMTMAAPMPYAAWNGGNDFLFPYGRRNYWKGSMMTALDDSAFDQIIRFASDPPLPGLSVTIEFYGGAVSRPDPNATAFPHRDARYQVVINTQWDDPADDARVRSWARDLHDAIEPSGKPGPFLNFVGVDGDDRLRRIRAGYGQHWDRLVDIKRRYDPDNVFHRNNTIVP